VIHGDRDRMVHPTGGSATARAIPGARLETIIGLGHDLPIGGWGRIIDLITDHTASVKFAVHRGAPVTHTELEEHP
jgi:pimeloyl-ACP methyl ester carboxylesterase